MDLNRCSNLSVDEFEELKNILENLKWSQQFTAEDSLSPVLGSGLQHGSSPPSSPHLWPSPQPTSSYTTTPRAPSSWFRGRCGAKILLPKRTFVGPSGDVGADMDMAEEDILEGQADDEDDEDTMEMYESVDASVPAESSAHGATSESQVI